MQLKQSTVLTIYINIGTSFPFHLYITYDFELYEGQKRTTVQENFILVNN